MKTIRRCLSAALLAITSAVAVPGCSDAPPAEVDATEGAVAARDDSETFKKALAALEDKRNVEALIASLEVYRIVFVPGFYDVAAALEKPGTPPEAYFEDEMQWLEDQGICWSMAEGGTLATPKENAKLVQREIETPRFSRVRSLKRFFGGHFHSRHCETKKAILVSHSRGGVDVLEALLDEPSLSLRESRVAGWISLQAPFHGSRLASELTVLLGDKVTRENVTKLAKFMQNIGSLEKAGEGLEKQAPNIDRLMATMKIISVEDREAALEARKDDLRRLISTRLPIIAVGTVQPDIKKVPELLEIPRDYLEKKYGPNDGFLVRGAAKLPGASYVEFEGDHLSTVFFLGGLAGNSSLMKLAERVLNILTGSKRPDRVLSFAALLRMNLDAIDRRGSGHDPPPIEGGCWSSTLAKDVVELTCVESRSVRVWMQCKDGSWYRGVDGDAGPFGTCAERIAL